jgi:hypothetical protein
MAIGKIYRPLNRCCREPLSPCRSTYHHPRQAGAKAENCAQRFLFRELHTYLFIPLGLVSDVFRPLNALLDSDRRRLANKAHLCAKRATRCHSTAWLACIGHLVSRSSWVYVACALARNSLFWFATPGPHLRLCLP